MGIPSEAVDFLKIDFSLNVNQHFLDEMTLNMLNGVRISMRIRKSMYADSDIHLSLASRFVEKILCLSIS